MILYTGGRRGKGVAAGGKAVCNASGVLAELQRVEHDVSLLRVKKRVASITISPAAGERRTVIGDQEWQDTHLNTHTC